MEKEFVNYEQALKLKGLEFDEKTLMFVSHSSGYDTYTKEKYKSILWLCNGYKAKNQDSNEFEYEFPEHGENWTKVHIPIFQQAFRWFRTKYDLHLMADDVYYDGNYSYAFQISSKGVMICGTTPSSDYEEAKLDCLNKLIEIAQNK